MKILLGMMAILLWAFGFYWLVSLIMRTFGAGKPSQPLTYAQAQAIDSTVQTKVQEWSIKNGAPGPSTWAELGIPADESNLVPVSSPSYQNVEQWWESFMGPVQLGITKAGQAVINFSNKRLAA